MQRESTLAQQRQAIVGPTLAKLNAIIPNVGPTKTQRLPNQAVWPWYSLRYNRIEFYNLFNCYVAECWCYALDIKDSTQISHQFITQILNSKNVPMTSWLQLIRFKQKNYYQISRYNKHWYNRYWKFANHLHLIETW